MALKGANVDNNILDAHQTSVAIIGMSGRFPGAASVNEFWENIQAGVESIQEFTEDELLAEGISPDVYRNKNFVPKAGALADVDKFAAEFFGYTPKEAEVMDPQIRLFLELCWEALEDGAQVVPNYAGKIGVFAGSGFNSYLINNLLPKSEELSSLGILQVLMGNKSDFLTTQVSYKLNLKGPSISINTACSTSLVAIHMACNSLLNYESDMVLAGGVSIQFPLKSGYQYQPGGVFSPDGHCRAFDNNAGGTVPGNGAGVVLLKRLEDAIRDKDSIYCIIKGSAINNDGARKAGFSAPSIQGQAEVIASALAMAEVEPQSISFIEAHGTGTALGDPIEIKALNQVFRKDSFAGKYCVLGSVKANIGHLDAAAGVASLIKAALCLRYKTLVPSINYEQPNPAIEFEKTPFRINTRKLHWESDAGEPRRAGVSSFGIGGTNAHLILEEWASQVSDGNQHRNRIANQQPSINRLQLFPLSAQNSFSQLSYRKKLRDHLSGEHAANTYVADIAFTLQTCRQAFSHRTVILAENKAELLTALAENNHSALVSGVADGELRPIVFMLSGTGDQHYQMARELYEKEPWFKSQFDQCNSVVIDRCGIDLYQLLYASDSAPRAEVSPTNFMRLVKHDDEPRTDKLDYAVHSHLALFTIEYSLAKLWMHWGIQPAAMIGHSLGEYTAACLSGVFSVEDAITIIHERARLIESLEGGAMLAVFLPASDIEQDLPGDCSVAAANAPAMSVLSGPKSSLGQVSEALRARGVASRFVNSNHPFHSKMLEPIRSDLMAIIRSKKLNPITIPYIANLTGQWISNEQVTSPGYWADHTCKMVKFRDGIELLNRELSPVFLEVGPGQTLCSFTQQTLLKNGVDNPQVLPSLPGQHEAENDQRVILHSAARLWCQGQALEWDKFHPDLSPAKTHLPSYAFDRQSFFIHGEGISALQTKSIVANKTTADGKIAMDSKISTDKDVAGVTQQSSTTTNDIHEAEQEIHAELSSVIASLWQELLGVKAVSAESNFFRLGGNSLQAVQLIARLDQLLEISIDLKSVFENPYFGQLCTHVKAVLLAGDMPADNHNMGNPIDIESISVPYCLPNKLWVEQFNEVETQHFYHDIFESEVYAKNGLSLADDCVVFDVGANIGLFSLFVLNKVNNPKIYAFEPAPPIFKALEKNVSGYGAHVKLYNCGISNKPDSQELVFYPNSTGMSSFYANKEEEKHVLKSIIENQYKMDQEAMEPIVQSLDTILDRRFVEKKYRCEMKTISGIIASENIATVDLIKIDIQKAELDALMGIDECHWPKIRQVVIEVHDIDGRVNFIESFFQQRGFKVYSEQDDLYSGSGIWNLYAIRQELN
jgi:phthiocerol/phenolphthiocerol synthesis type-I polyketide synthase E